MSSLCWSYDSIPNWATRVSYDGRLLLCAAMRDVMLRGHVTVTMLNSTVRVNSSSCIYSVHDYFDMFDELTSALTAMIYDGRMHVPCTELFLIAVHMFVMFSSCTMFNELFNWWDAMDCLWRVPLHDRQCVCEKGEYVILSVACCTYVNYVLFCSCWARCCCTI